MSFNDTWTISYREKWARRFLDLADHVAQWSKDPSTKVGAVIARQNEIISVGYNGFPRHIRDIPELYENREAKLLRVIHAEVNAIKYAKGNTINTDIYISIPPCQECAKHIIVNDIDSVWCWQPDESVMKRYKESFENSRQLFDEAGVGYYWIPKVQE